MTKKKAAPGLENRNETREPHRFPKGVSGNPGGRPKKNPEVKEFCKSQSIEMVRKLYSLVQDESTKVSDVISIARLFLEYGIGKPSAENDRERLDIEKRLADARIAQIEREESEGPQQIEVLISGPAKELGM